MRNIFGIGLTNVVLLLLGIIVNTALSQEIDVIYLKNGKSVSGKIVERIPDKTVVIETKDGIEFVDYVDIRQMRREFIPTIASITPQTAAPGSVVSITGQFPSAQPNYATVLIGGKQAQVQQWKKDLIDVVVPSMDMNEYAVTVQIGSQSDAARITVGITQETAMESKIVARRSQPVVQETGYDPGGFWVLFGYMMPQNEYAMTDGFNSTNGYAKDGFSVGFEGRIALSQSLYLPINFQAANMGYNIDELQKQTPVSVSSENKINGLIWLTGGLGLAIHLSSESFIFVSGDYGMTMVHRPDTKFGTTGFVEYKTANTFTPGYGFSAGFTFSGVTIGYRTFSAKPKHKVELAFSGSTQTQEVEIEQKVDVGMVYIAF
jgi:hypothetical protein